MEAEITIKEISANISLSQSELSLLKQYTDGTLQLETYMSSIVGEDVMKFARGLDEFLTETIKRIG